MFESFAQRSPELERLDTGDYTPEEYSKWLDEAKLINRWLGDAKALRLTLEEQPCLANEANISLLDIGAGSGELLKSAKEVLNGRSGAVTGVEMSAVAAAAIAKRHDEFGVNAVMANGMYLPFADESYDVVFCSLVLHHLADGDAVKVIAEMYRVSSRLMVVIDLFRSPLPYYLYRTLSPIFLQRMTVEDGSLSILRAFRPDELKGLAVSAGITNAAVRRAAFRLILTASK